MYDPETRYRAYIVGNDGHITDDRPFTCANDDDAIAAKQWVDTTWSYGTATALSFG